MHVDLMEVRISGPAANSPVRVLDLQPPTLVPLQALWPQHATGNARRLLTVSVN